MLPLWKGYPNDSDLWSLVHLILVYFFDDKYGRKWGLLSVTISEFDKIVMVFSRTGLFTPDMAFEIIVKDQIQRLKQPTLNCVDLVVNEVTDVIRKCTDKVSEDYRVKKDASVQPSFEKHFIPPISFSKYGLVLLAIQETNVQFYESRIYDRATVHQLIPVFTLGFPGRILS